MPKFKKFFKKHESTAKKALRLALMTKSLLNVEYKHIDTSAVTLTPSSTGATYSLNACSQGDTSSQRSGLSVRMKSLILKSYYVQHASSVNTSIRLAVVLDKSPNSNLATWDEIYEENKPVSMTNNVTNYRFKILYDRIITLSGTGQENGTVFIFKQLNHVVKYSGTTGTENDIEKNQLLIAIISNEATNVPNFQYSARVRYLDN